MLGCCSVFIIWGSSACGSSGLTYGLINAFTGLACLYSCSYRSKLRGQYHLEESPCVDCLVHFCCECCALCQEYRELKKRGFDLGIGMYIHCYVYGSRDRWLPQILLFFFFFLWLIIIASELEGRVGPNLLLGFRNILVLSPELFYCLCLVSCTFKCPALAFVYYAYLLQFWFLAILIFVTFMAPLTLVGGKVRHKKQKQKKHSRIKNKILESLRVKVEKKKNRSWISTKICQNS